MSNVPKSSKKEILTVIVSADNITRYFKKNTELTCIWKASLPVYFEFRISNDVLDPFKIWYWMSTRKLNYRV